MLEMTIEGTLDCKEIKLVNRKKNKPWIVIGMTYDESKDQKLLQTYENSWFPEKHPEAGEDWRQKGKTVAKDEMVR